MVYTYKYLLSLCPFSPTLHQAKRKIKKFLKEFNTLKEMSRTNQRFPVLFPSGLYLVRLGLWQARGWCSIITLSVPAQKATAEGLLVLGWSWFQEEGLFPEFTEPGSSQQSAVSALLLSTCENTCAHPSLGSTLCSESCENCLFISPLISFRAQPWPLQAYGNLSLSWP